MRDYLPLIIAGAVIGAFLEEQNQAVKLVDPVMGDDGRLYSGLTPERAAI